MAFAIFHFSFVEIGGLKMENEKWQMTYGK